MPDAITNTQSSGARRSAGPVANDQNDAKEVASDKKPRSPINAVIAATNFDDFVEGLLKPKDELDGPVIDGADAADPEGLSKKLDTAAVFSASDMFALFSMLIKIVREQRTSMLEQRIAYRKESLESSKAECAAMTEAANKRFAGEMAGAIAGIIGGAVQGLTAAGALVQMSTSFTKQTANAQAMAVEADKKILHTGIVIEKKLEIADLKLGHRQPRAGLTVQTEITNAKSVLNTAEGIVQNTEARISKLSIASSLLDSKVRIASAVESLGGVANTLGTSATRVVTAQANQQASLSDVAAKRAANKKEIADIDQQTAFDQATQWRDFVNQLVGALKEVQQSTTQTEVNIAKGMI